MSTKARLESKEERTLKIIGKWRRHAGCERVCSELRLYGSTRDKFTQRIVSVGKSSRVCNSAIFFTPKFDALKAHTLLPSHDPLIPFCMLQTRHPPPLAPFIPGPDPV